MRTVRSACLTATILLSASFTGACRAPQQVAAGAPETAVAIFDGQTLAGWHPQVADLPLGRDPEHIFSVHDGVIHAYGDTAASATVPFGYLLSDAEYEDFVLTFDFRWGEKKFAPRANDKRDAGLLFHVHGENKVWPRSLELQIQERDVGDIFTVGTAIETTIAPASVVPGDIPAASFLPADEGGIIHSQGDAGITRIVKRGDAEQPGWNTIELRAKGDEAEYRVNGVVVNRFRALRSVEVDGTHRALRKGRFALQAEGAEVMYRNLKIQKL